jgi:transcriptional regulator with XRE-family HTH domain
MNTIGGKMKQIRKIHNMNQVEFSNALGISQGRLSEIEQDKTKPSAETLIALREKFDVNLNWLPVCRTPFKFFETGFWPKKACYRVETRNRLALKELGKIDLRVSATKQ